MWRSEHVVLPDDSGQAAIDNWNPIMKSIFSAAIVATVLAPVVSGWLARLPDAIRDALKTRAEVSAIMAEAYRRQY
ncbi:hypothetical protein PQR02_05605 [Paraburkholderia sediminicola]|uniref:Uncharacterized protein n=1 Tax=Paraburkholderia rhynchosiae TaxID=487049 RepID=A0ACC7N8J0_9BURK